MPSTPVVVCGQAICDYTAIIYESKKVSVVVCGQAICDYTSFLWLVGARCVVVCGQAICDYTSAISRSKSGDVVVCGQAICDYTKRFQTKHPRQLWFAVRLYAITLFITTRYRTVSCGLRSGYMRLHY